MCMVCTPPYMYTTLTFTLMQEHVALVALDETFAALRQHPSVCGVQEWGLKLLTNLTQVTAALRTLHVWVYSSCCLLLLCKRLDTPKAVHSSDSVAIVLSWLNLGTVH